MSNDSFIVDAVRTPVGRLGGALAGVRPDDLAAVAVKALVSRTPSLDPARIDEVYFGDANGAGEDNRNVARMATLLAGLPTSIPGATVNRLCGSGMEALFGASRTVIAGDADIAIARVVIDQGQMACLAAFQYLEQAVDQLIWNASGTKPAHHDGRAVVDGADGLHHRIGLLVDHGF